MVICARCHDVTVNRHGCCCRFNLVVDLLSSVGGVGISPPPNERGRQSNTHQVRRASRIAIGLLHSLSWLIPRSALESGLQEASCERRSPHKTASALPCCQKRSYGPCGANMRHPTVSRFAEGSFRAVPFPLTALPDLLGLSRRHLQQSRSPRNRALPVLTGHRGGCGQRRPLGHAGADSQVSVLRRSIEPAAPLPNAGDSIRHRHIAAPMQSAAPLDDVPRHRTWSHVRTSQRASRSSAACGHIDHTRPVPTRRLPPLGSFASSHLRPAATSDPGSSCTKREPRPRSTGSPPDCHQINEPDSTVRPGTDSGPA